MRELEREGKIIELRAYNTVHGIWYYFTADDGQFSGNEVVWQSGHWSLLKKCRIILERKCNSNYIQVDDGVRLERALERERTQKEPKYAELADGFLQMRRIFGRKFRTAWNCAAF